MVIQFEKEVCDFLSLPNVPKKEWDKKSSFKHGVCVLKLAYDGYVYAVCSFDADYDKAPRVTKVFGQEPFGSIEKIFVVPSFMETDVLEMDLDEESKAAAEILAQESQELVNEENNEIEFEFPQNEYSFDNIHNDEEAIAFITSYNKEHGIRGTVPTKHETLVMRLAVIHSDLQKKQSKENKRKERRNG